MMESNKKIKKLYISQSYFNLLIAIIKAIKDPQSENYLLITNGWSSGGVLLDNALIKRLKNSGIFNKVFLDDYEIDYRATILKSKIKWIKKYFFIKKMKKHYPIDFQSYDELYIFSDMSTIGLFLKNQKIPYNVIEDGTNCYKSNRNLIITKWNFKKFIKHFFGVRDMGTSKLIKSVEVNDLNGIFINNPNIIEVPRKELFHSLTLEEAKRISYIFLNQIDLLQFNGYSLLIPQPLSKDNLLDSDEQQLMVYDRIIDNYLKNEKVLIKTHPRDPVDYSKLNNHCEILKENFPLELSTFFKDLKFKKVITISSTSINVLDNCEEKIELGWDWLKEVKKELEKNEIEKKEK